MEKETHLPTGFEEDYINESHIQEFEKALKYEDQEDNSYLSRDDSVVSLGGVTTPKSTGIETITSQSDWMPVYNKTKRKTRRNSSFTERHPLLRRQTSNIHTSGAETETEKPLSSASSQYMGAYDEYSLTFTILRYPLLAFIIGWTCVLSFLYFLVRLSITLSEKLILAKDKKRTQLLDGLKNSKNYDEYIAHAKKLDEYLGLAEWCNQDKYKYYDWRNLRKTIHNLRKFRYTQRYDDLMVVLQTCVKSNFAGTENPLLYSHCYYGTKKLIERYNAEVVKSLETIIKAENISLKEKRIFFKIINKNFGRTCLVLSGGASFCYNHFGVIKALIENDLMPKIVSGTSGGGMIAALVGSRTNEELLKLITPKLSSKMNAFGTEPFWEGIKRWWKTGARFDSVDWARKAQWWTRGSTTFEESYKKTGKIINISTVPNDIHSPTILCNYITSPSCCIWSAMLASAAVPGILNPVMLMEKTKDGTVRPFSLGSKWKDGSLRTDVPLSTLNMYFNTKFSIVSQVNPHVMLWIFKNRGDIGKPVVRSKGKTYRGGFILSYLENLIKLEIIKWLKLVKEFQLFPNLLESDWSNIFLQNFGGTITLFPKIVLSDYKYILSDPNEERLESKIRNGESVTYPKLLFIKHRLNIERTIEKGLEATRINIDDTADAPPNLVQNIIENNNNLKNSEDAINSEVDDVIPDAANCKNTQVVDKDQDISNEEDLSHSLSSESDVPYGSDDLPSDHSEYKDESDDVYGNNLDTLLNTEHIGRANLGFLGIQMGIDIENSSDFSANDGSFNEDNFFKNDS